MNKLIQWFFDHMANRFVSRWLILTKDLIIVWLSFLFSYVVRFNFDYYKILWNEVLWNSLFFVFICALWFTIFKTYAGIVRHTSIDDVLRVFKSLALGTVTAWIVGLIDRSYFNGINYLKIGFKLDFSCMY